MVNLKLPIGIADHKEVIEGQYDFVDKSLFIKEFIDDPAKASLIIRPRRFGKSYNFSMLRYFFDIQNAEENRALFKNTLIEKAKSMDGVPCMDYQGQYPVIMLTVKGIRPKDDNDFVQLMAEKMAELYQTHAYLLESSHVQPADKKIIQAIIDRSANLSILRTSLHKLTRYLYQHYQKKVMVFMDEYDTPIHSAYLGNPPFHQELCDFMKIFMGEAFKDNEYLEKGLVTGILRIGMMDLFSGVNSIATRTMMDDDYVEFFGFTEAETEALVTRHSADLNKAQLSERLASIKAWYNGYQIGDTLLYNPWSIIQCLQKKGKLAPYWNASGEDSLLGKTLINAPFDVKEDLTHLIQQGAIDVSFGENAVLADLSRDDGALWHMMLSSGYLKVLGQKEGPVSTLYTVAIPNQELMMAYRQIVQYWFSPLSTKSYVRLFQSLSEGHLDRFEALVKQYLEESVSARDLGAKTLEKYYHVLILGMFFVLKDLYVVSSNKESGFGFYDIVLIPNDPNMPGYVFEFKVPDKKQHLVKSAEAALAQIDQKKYDACFQQAKAQCKTITHVGMAFYGKAMHMVHRVC